MGLFDTPCFSGPPSISIKSSRVAACPRTRFQRLQMSRFPSELVGVGLRFVWEEFVKLKQLLGLRIWWFMVVSNYS